MMKTTEIPKLLRWRREKQENKDSDAVAEQKDSPKGSRFIVLAVDNENMEKKDNRMENPSSIVKGKANSENAEKSVNVWKRMILEWSILQAVLSLLPKLP